MKYLLSIILLFTLTSASCPSIHLKKYIGVTEQGGNNMGFTSKEFQQDLQKVGWKKGHAWCAYTVISALNKCGVKHTITGWSPTSYNKKDVIFTDAEFKQTFSNDDVIVMSLSYDKFKSDRSRFKGIGHTGIVEKIGAHSAVILEGNTNDAGDRDSRTTDGVYRKRRPLTRNTHLTRWKKYEQSIPM
jgi:hypothetical protein